MRHFALYFKDNSNTFLITFPFLKKPINLPKWGQKLQDNLNKKQRKNARKTYVYLKTVHQQLSQRSSLGSK